MFKNLYSVVDTRSNIFGNPFSSINNQTALRDFNRAFLDPNTDIHHFPIDYCLYHIGTFNDVTGAIVPCFDKLGPASQFLEVNNV